MLGNNKLVAFMATTDGNRARQFYGEVLGDERGVWKAPSGARVAWFKDPDGNTLSLTQS